jgi:hypothetical protein
MADATVFVDDAVLGWLPPICVKDGVLTTDTLTTSSVVRDGTGLGIAWLLVLFGPLGWILLLLLAATRRPADTLTVQLPFSEVAYERLRRAKRDIWPYAVAACVLGVSALVALGHHDRLLAGVLGVVLVLAAVQWARALRRVRTCSVTVELDASRRWVTLRRVHPMFAEGCSHNPMPPMGLDVGKQDR